MFQTSEYFTQSNNEENHHDNIHNLFIDDPIFNDFPSIREGDATEIVGRKLQQAKNNELFPFSPFSNDRLTAKENFMQTTFGYKLNSSGKERLGGENFWGLSAKFLKLNFHIDFKNFPHEQISEDGDIVKIPEEKINGSLTKFLNRKRFGRHHDLGKK